MVIQVSRPPSLVPPMRETLPSMESTSREKYPRPETVAFFMRLPPATVQAKPGGILPLVEREKADGRPRPLPA